MMAAASCSVRIIPFHRSCLPYLGFCSFPSSLLLAPLSLLYSTPILPALSTTLRTVEWQENIWKKIIFSQEKSVMLDTWKLSWLLYIHKVSVFSLISITLKKRVCLLEWFFFYLYRMLIYSWNITWKEKRLQAIKICIRWSDEIHG